MRHWSWGFAAALLTGAVVFTTAFQVNVAVAGRGKIIGAMAHNIPSWFKESFLDLREDAAEAVAANKHLIIFMHLNGCPYCAKMLTKVFEGDKDYIQKHFDSIAINIKGARTVTVNGSELTEKAYASKLRVVFTPTVIFLNGDAKPVFRINGYWNKQMFRHALEFVASSSYKTMKLSAFIKARAAQQAKPAVYRFRKHPLLAEVKDFSKLTKPVAILFEDKDCLAACTKLHDRILNRPAIMEELKRLVFTRLDAYSDHPIIDIAGNRTTPQNWARKLGLASRPGLVIFADGKERQRIGGELYEFHFKHALRYVSGRHYKQFANWIEYLNQEQEKLLSAGKTIDISERPAAGQ